MVNRALPEGWKWKTLGDAVRFQKGKKPDLLGEESTPGFLPYVDIQAFEEKTVRKFGNPQKGVFVDAGEIMLVWDGARAGLVGKSIKGLVGSTISLVKPLDVLIEISYITFCKAIIMRSIPIQRELESHI
jgi:type I restriction enzyme S subunit